MAEQAEACLPELGLKLGLARLWLGLCAFHTGSAQLEMRISPHRHDHRVATDPMELAQHGQPMLRTGDVLKQLHAKNAINRVRRQTDGEG